MLWLYSKYSEHTLNKPKSPAVLSSFEKSNFSFHHPPSLIEIKNYYKKALEMFITKRDTFEKVRVEACI